MDPCILDFIISLKIEANIIFSEALWNIITFYWFVKYKLIF